MSGKELGSMTLPAGWTMSIEEVSAGVYALVARDPAGLTVRRNGTDLALLVEECRADIAELMRRQGRP